MKRISRKPSEQTPFERFFLEFPRLLQEAGGVVYNAKNLAEIGWSQRAAQLLFAAMGEPDWRDKPAPPEQPGGDWIGEEQPGDPADVPETRETCSECGLFQMETPSGMTCPNGHGGAAGEPAETHMWWHPESGSLFTTAPGEEFPKDGLVEHLDEASYLRIRDQHVHAARFAMDPVEGGSDEDDFTL